MAIKQLVLRLAAGAALILLGVAANPTLSGETRRALLVGIDQYDGKNLTPRKQRGALNRIPVQGVEGRSKIQNLEGAVSDAQLMRDLLIQRFHFPQGNVRLLADGQATADEILSSLKQMIESSQADDIAVFYYAGHGSEIRNTKTKDGMDQTLVPADSEAGTADIRDKEIARMLRLAVARKVKFTLIADSCHSGSIGRGVVRKRGKVRGEPPVEGAYVEDPPEMGQDGKPIPAPEESGVVILAAAQSYQLASETTQHEQPHGLFTYSLVQALSTASDDLASQVFSRTRALMHAEASDQDPSIAGLVKGRENEGIFGQPVAQSKTGVAVNGVEEEVVTLQGGFVLGLKPGCELTRETAGGEIRLEVTGVRGPAIASAKVTKGLAADVHAGDIFTVASWSAPNEPLLKVYVPPAYKDHGGLDAVIASVSKACGMAKATLSADPTVATPTHTIWWDGSQWTLIETDNGVSRKLKDGFTASELVQALAGSQRARIALVLPPPPELLERMGLGKTGRLSAIATVSSPGEAQYVLVGRAGKGSDDQAGPSYAWVLPSDDEESWKREDEEAVKGGNPLPMHVLPMRTAWVSAGAGAGDTDRAANRLAELALRLGRIRGWMELTAPEPSMLSSVHLRLLPEGGKAPITSGVLRDGEHYKLMLYPDRAWRSAVASQWIYVFEIASDGTSSLLFPSAGQGDVGNSRLPLPSGTSDPVPLFPEAGYELEISAPFGTDTYLLLQTRDPLGSPQILEGASVQANSRGVETSIDKLIRNAVSGSRSGTVKISSGSWSIEKLTFRSVGRGGI